MSRLHQQRATNPPTEDTRREPKFIVELGPRTRNFFSNLAVAARPQETHSVDLDLRTATASFWPDVFVGSGTPWRGLAQSVVYHALFCFLIWNLTQTWLHTQQITFERPFDKNTVIYYTVSDYLPPIQSKGALTRSPRKGDPRRAKQEIISVPPDADNDHQTIITPPDIKLRSDRRLPNIVAWTPVPSTVPLTGAVQTKLAVPALPGAVIAPPPEVSRDQTRRVELLQPDPVAPAIDASALTQAKAPAIPIPAVVEPAPQIEQVEKIGSLNMAQLQPQAQAPKITIPAQRTPPSSATVGQGAGGTQQLPPSPETASIGSERPTGQIVALSLDPAEPVGSLEIPQGNRRGTFAATPTGREAATGTPDIKAVGTDGGGGGASADARLAGINVSPGPAALSSPITGATAAALPRPPRNLIAAAMVPHNLRDLSRRTSPLPPPDLPETDVRVFGTRKFYSMVLNMPNLNSAGGSWVIRFAELKAGSPAGELIAPVATEKVDPEYPAELMRQRLEGTVTLYAVIRSDGTVADVRVLNGIDGRLDEFARAAIARWRFRPATKNGNAVDLEAVIHIPFQSRRTY